MDPHVLFKHRQRQLKKRRLSRFLRVLKYLKTILRRNPSWFQRTMNALLPKNLLTTKNSTCLKTKKTLKESSESTLPMSSMNMDSNKSKVGSPLNTTKRKRL
nr:hypothetical protein [Crucivirus sp.]